jgi:hypothetical protein
VSLSELRILRRVIPWPWLLGSFKIRLNSRKAEKQKANAERECGKRVGAVE